MDCGPLKVFVAHRNMPPTFKLDTNAAPKFVDQEGEVEITTEPPSLVRLRIIGLKTEADGLSAIGSIKEDYLGVISE